MIGEGVNDYGGPYRAVFEALVAELQRDDGLLPLFVPTENRAHSVPGSDVDRWALNRALTTRADLKLVRFFGSLVGAAVRAGLNLGFSLERSIWQVRSSFLLFALHISFLFAQLLHYSSFLLFAPSGSRSSSSTAAARARTSARWPRARRRAAAPGRRGARSRRSWAMSRCAAPPAPRPPHASRGTTCIRRFRRADGNSRPRTRAPRRS